MIIDWTDKRHIYIDLDYVDINIESILLILYPFQEFVAITRDADFSGRSTSQKIAVLRGVSFSGRSTQSLIDKDRDFNLKAKR